MYNVQILKVATNERSTLH